MWGIDKHKSCKAAQKTKHSDAQWESRAPTRHTSQITRVMKNTEGMSATTCLKPSIDPLVQQQQRRTVNQTTLTCAAGVPATAPACCAQRRERLPVATSFLMQRQGDVDARDDLYPTSEASLQKTTFLPSFGMCPKCTKAFSTSINAHKSVPTPA